jgi:hypothetical protein
VRNLRRVAGYDVQYFATVEPQKRLAPHLHMAIRGTLPRAEIKAIAAATYHQVWWPAVGVRPRHQAASFPFADALTGVEGLRGARIAVARRE